MSDRQALFEKFCNFLQSEPALPEYLGEEPETVTPFDPYQMVAEWIALRHEVKQQGKLFQAAQKTLQQALEEIQTQKAEGQQRWSESQTQGLSESQREQKTLLRDMLAVVDALDRACAHWQEQLEELAQSQSPSSTRPQPFWKKCMQRLIQPDQHQARSASRPSSLYDILVSNQEGVALIRRSLLDILRQRQVVPIEAKGYPFDPQKMYAVGRQETESFSENTVIQEVVRGYMWGEQVLREAQVIVSARKYKE